MRDCMLACGRMHFMLELSGKGQWICQLPAFNFNGQSLKLPDECGHIISDHTEQHGRNKRSMINPEPCTLLKLVIAELFIYILTVLSILR